MQLRFTGYVLLFLWRSEVFAWEVECCNESKQNDVLDECLQMSQVDYFSEATAIHLRVEDYKK